MHLDTDDVDDDDDDHHQDEDGDEEEDDVHYRLVFNTPSYSLPYPPLNFWYILLIPLYPF